MKTEKSLQWQEEEALRRYQMITPLIDPTIDVAARQEKRKEISDNYGISTRTLYRYEKDYRNGGFSALKPKGRAESLSPRLPVNFNELMEEAKQLKREVPTRSVVQIIYILEGEGRVDPGVLKRSTVQRHLYEAGFGKKQMRKYNEGQKSVSTRRFCKPHRMMLTQADIKYGVGIVIQKNGKKDTAYLSSIIDDHSRHLLASEWYANQEEYVVEDIFRKAILKAGKFDACYCDNGKQYISRQLRYSCGLLDIRILHAQPRAGWQKGKIEKFHQIVDQFIAEVKLKKLDNLEDINRYWTYFRDEYYEHKPHDGIREYYESNGIRIPGDGISPLTEWNRDSRQLQFIDAGVVGEAFLYHEKRIVDKGGCISFKGTKYEVSAKLIGAEVGVTYSPNDYSTLKITYRDMEPLTVRPVRISGSVTHNEEKPIALQETPPETSRMLDVIEKKYKERNEKRADAISYGDLISEEEN